MNDYQKHRFSLQIIDSLFNTVSGKKIAFLGWAFKKDTNDTRESAAIYVAYELLQDQAEIHIFDPKVTKEQIFKDLKNVTESPSHPYAIASQISDFKVNGQIIIHSSPYPALADAHAIAILTEWNEFKSYDWQRIYDSMKKPAFIFDGRNLLDHEKMRKIGFEIRGIGKG